MKILLVDDAAFMRLVLRNIIEYGKHEVVGEAYDGQMGIDLYEVLKPDLVFMDITMPNLSGLDAVKVIRKRHPGARVVMCSAMGQQWLVMEAIQAGASDFIVKPFKPEAILYILKKFEKEISDAKELNETKK